MSPNHPFPSHSPPQNQTLIILISDVQLLLKIILRELNTLTPLSEAKFTRFCLDDLSSMMATF